MIIRILAALVCLVVVSGSASAGPLPGSFEGRWVLNAVRGVPLTTDMAQRPYFIIQGKNIEGFDGCNRFSGNLTNPAEIQATQMGCPEGWTPLPLDLANPLAHLKSGKISGRELLLPPRTTLPGASFKRD